MTPTSVRHDIAKYQEYLTPEVRADSSDRWLYTQMLRLHLRLLAAYKL